MCIPIAFICGRFNLTIVIKPTTMIDPRHINIILEAIHKSKAGEVKDATGTHFDLRHVGLLGHRRGCRTRDQRIAKRKMGWAAGRVLDNRRS